MGPSASTIGHLAGTVDDQNLDPACLKRGLAFLSAPIIPCCRPVSRTRSLSGRLPPTRSFLTSSNPILFRRAALSPDGQRLAAGLDNGDIVLWDLATQKPLQTLTTTLGCIFSMEFSPDGTHLAAAGSLEKPFCSGGGLIYIWDLAGGTI